MLLPGETLLWQGRPAEGVHWRLRMETVIFLIIGSVMLCASIPFFTAVLFLNMPVFFLLFSLPFFLVGVIFLAFVLLYPFFESRRLEKQRYAVTDQRLLLWNPHYLFVYQVREITGLQIKVFKDGSGTIYTEHRTMRGRTLRYIFEEIPEVERVFRLIKCQRAGA